MEDGTKNAATGRKAKRDYDALVRETSMANAERAFDAGVPIELWAYMVCEALGLDHNLPRTLDQLIEAFSNDINNLTGR